MKETIAFLNELAAHNEREWFMAHKAEYQAIAARFSDFVAEIIEGIRSFDDTIGPLTPRDCTYRIYRDIRFSRDKSPYKTHMGAFINRGGKKSDYIGYYFHVGSAEEGNIVAAGDMCVPTEVLKIVREDIELGGGDFRAMLSKVDPRMEIDESTALKRVPAPFPADTPDSPYYKLRNYCLCYFPEDSFFTSKHLKDELLALFRSTKPFIDHINRAVEYMKENR